MSKAENRISDYISDKLGCSVTPEELGDAVYFDRMSRPKGWRSIVLVSARNLSLKARAQRQGFYLSRTTRLGAGNKALFTVEVEK